jgi:hypothetical protein
MNTVDKAKEIATDLGIGYFTHEGETVRKNEFQVCCIGHAVTLSMYLTGRRISHRHEGVNFVIDEEGTEVREPRVVNAYFQQDLAGGWRMITFSFDISVAEYAQRVAKIGEDDGLEQYQHIIESVEHRVAVGMFGSTHPEQVRVSWDKLERLSISWRDS